MRIILALMLCLSIAACATVPVSKLSTYCRIAEPLTWSQNDSRDTVIGVKTHNKVYETTCEGK